MVMLRVVWGGRISKRLHTCLQNCLFKLYVPHPAEILIACKAIKIQLKISKSTYHSASENHWINPVMKVTYVSQTV